MWIINILLLFASHSFATTNTSDQNVEPDLYYYGIEESERSLPACGARQACAALVARAWRAAALLRLCRCPRRRRCDTPAPLDARIPINNRDYFQFCQSVSSWSTCNVGDAPLTVDTAYDRIDPDQLDELHHKNIQLVPPKITFKCRCPEPNYWKQNTTVESDNIQVYKCASMPPCKSEDFCGNFNYDLNTLYQSCLCPKHHICVHNGGITHLYISELLYRGKGWRAYCQRVGEDSYEDYY
ncbi:uncharacterized protein LOC126372410 [Pectinophora gossypiella]|uniref:uncharacterized protein LOC126372410 n=1 Tax=Pectinophora gossypiella TaxID=13191 RepID=UPI00214F1E78|nr:uncharacterized protein LOC126372410 [Pectinophora gossypiella]